MQVWFWCLLLKRFFYFIFQNLLYKISQIVIKRLLEQFRVVSFFVVFNVICIHTMYIHLLILWQLLGNFLATFRQFLATFWQHFGNVYPQGKPLGGVGGRVIF